MKLKLNTTTGRATRVALAGIAAALGAALAVLLSAGHDQRASAAEMTGHHAAAPASARAVALEAGMNKLWEDHVTWTRMVIVEFAAGLPGLKAAEVRLLRNQTDIGDAIKPYYGTAAGNRLTSLLRAHILGAIPVLRNAKAGDKVGLTRSLAAWYANAHRIAAFLGRANPDNWPLQSMESMMKQHLALTTKEAVARLQGRWAADVAAYDQVHNEILDMAHMLAAGIVAQFPDRF